MAKFLELLLGEAFKYGLKKLFGVKEERNSDTAGNLGCLMILLMAVLYPIGIYWLKPRLATGSFWYEHVYTWPLYIFGLWITCYLLRFVLYCLRIAPFLTLLLAGIIWFGWYAHKKGWM
ncbi:hypothetical protein [Cohnella laeviribosi]|uniref:hypothetical protein n=1 Tax=Cohnella laeviribosi TaxID=380174 RepID=UPI000361875A|nr:hypothetical protein [Cohnella laeviribosi]